MTDTEINIAIAEACGWYLARKKFPNDKGSKSKYSNGYRYQHKDGRWASAGTSMHGWGWCSSPDAAAYKLPDYCHDLNAMFVAENTLTNARKRFYVDMMIKVHPLHYNPLHPSDDGNMRVFFLLNTTARQRAEAFLRCLGRWIDK